LQAFKEASLRAGVGDITTIVVGGIAVASLGASLPLTAAAGIGGVTTGIMDAIGQKKTANPTQAITGIKLLSPCFLEEL
jgi:hypothetical protein